MSSSRTFLESRLNYKEEWREQARRYSGNPPSRKRCQYLPNKGIIVKREIMKTTFLLFTAPIKYSYGY